MVTVTFNMLHSLEKNKKLTSSFHKANISTLIPQCIMTARIKKKIGHLIYKYAKILIKILANRIQKHTERIIYCDQMEFILGMDISSNIRKSTNINHINSSKLKKSYKL